MLNFWPDLPWLRSRPELAEEDPPSLYRVPLTQLGVWPGTLSLAVADYAPDAKVAATLHSTARPVDGGSRPFDFGIGQRMPQAPFAGDRGLLLPRSAPLLFPNTAESGLLGLGLRSLVGEPPSDSYASSLRPDATGFDSGAPDVAPPAGNGAVDTILPAGIVRSETSRVDDPAYLPQPPQNLAQEILDQIAPSNAGIESKPFTAFDWLNFSAALAPFDARVAKDNDSGISTAFDPQFIVPVQAGGPPPMRPVPPVVRPAPSPQQPQPGIGHNRGPALDRPPPSRPAVSPQAAPGGLAPRAPSAAEPLPNAAGPAAAAEQQLDAPRPVHPLPRAAEAWPMIAKARNEEAPGGQYEGPDGQDTAIGVRLNPKLPEPAAGRDYVPPQSHLRTGYRGEVELANRVQAALPDELILHYGMRAGRHGPDVISLSPDGEISIWDSKARGWPRAIGSSAAAHQAKGSLRIALKQVWGVVEAAIEDGRIPPETAQKALENAKRGNVFINTIGTGNAHGGVVMCVRGGDFADCWGD